MTRPYRFRIKIYSSGIRVSYLTETERGMLFGYSKALAQYEMRRVRGRNVRELKYYFCVTFLPNSDYGFHRGHLSKLLAYLATQGVHRDDIELKYVKMYTPTPIDITINDNVELRPQQEPIMAFLEQELPVSTLNVKPGFGKTLLSIIHMAKYKVRSAVIMRASDIDTWVKDMGWIYKDPESHYEVYKGKKGLMDVISQAKDGILDKSILIFSINVMRDYFTEYETTGRSTYGCKPMEFFELLGVGLKVCDEAHLMTHFQYRLSINTNVPRTVYLSATIESHDKFTNELYETMFPPESIIKGGVSVKHVNITAVGYNFESGNVNPRTEGTSGYSHTTYEGWLMKVPHLLTNYIDMIKGCLNKFYLSNNYVVGQKALIFVATVAFSELVAESIRNDERFSHLKIESYTGVNETAVLHANDIVVTTPGSAGTGKDIKKLVTVIQTVAIKSLQANIQNLGRIRELDKTLYPNTTPQYAYLVCQSIPKQMQYHNVRKDIYRPLALSQQMMMYPQTI